MSRLFLILLFVFLCHNSSFGQSHTNASYSISYETDSSFTLSLQTTNYGVAKRVSLELTAFQKGEVFQNWNIDPLVLEKGINLIRRSIQTESNSFSPSDSIYFTAVLRNDNETKLHEGNFVYVPQLFRASSILVEDSTITINNPEPKAIQLEVSVSSIDPEFDSLASNFQLRVEKDSTVYWYGLVQTAPLVARKIEITNISDKSNATVIYYNYGKLTKEMPLENKAEDVEKEAKPKITLNGFVEVESNFFSKRPQHSNGAQYPFTSFRASNTISLYGIPFTINASHSTNDNISPNFRNFFSIQFDAASFRENAQQKLDEKNLAENYSLAEISTDLDKNNNALLKLESAKKIIQLYPQENIELDSLLSNEWDQIDYSLAQDSLFKLDSLFNDSLPFGLDSLPSDSLYDSDSTLNSQQTKLERIQRKIDQLKKSIALKEKYANQLKLDQQSLPSLEKVKPNELFSKFEPGSALSLLLRFEKLEIGNFYEYAGEYSIRDIEMKGVNTTFLINATTKVNFLTGEINDFQSFNLDDIEDSKKVNSVAFTNFSTNYFRPTLRITHFADKTIDPELSNTPEAYYVLTAKAEGEVAAWLNYQAEVNQSNQNMKPIEGFTASSGSNMSYFFQSYITPVRFLDVKLQYSKVGADYQSDGVYFLNRNTRTYTVGGKLRLFKNKLHLKNDFTVQERNLDNKSLTNKTQKQFFDVGTHFKRIPNIQISYSPISVEVANQLDTSFSGINANTNVLIARLFYFKKVKKTILTTALIYNEIENELADEFSTQKGIQHFASISNEKVNFSFTSAYNESFSSVRFLSASYAQAIGKKLKVQSSVAKNFDNNFYSEIIRSEVSYQFLKQFNLGLGGIFLVENQSNSVNSGGNVRLQFNY